MSDEFKSFEHHPDTRGPAKRGRPFLSIRRRITADTERKLKEEEFERFRDIYRLKMKMFLVMIALAPIA